MNAAYEGLIGSLAGAPSLPGARCRNRSHLFDPAEQYEPDHVVQQRHAQALNLCLGCPSLTRLRD